MNGIVEAKERSLRGADVALYFLKTYCFVRAQCDWFGRPVPVATGVAEFFLLSDAGRLRMPGLTLAAFGLPT